MKPSLLAGLIGISALMAGSALAQTTGAVTGTQASTAVNSAATTNQNSGLTIGSGTRINGGIHGVTTGDNSATTDIRTHANTRAESDALIDTTGHGRQAMTAAVNGTRTGIGVNSTARTNQYSGLAIAPGTRINGGIHNVRTGSTMADTRIRTDADARASANSRALRNDDGQGLAHGRSHHHKTKRHHRD